MKRFNYISLVLLMLIFSAAPVLAGFSVDVNWQTIKTDHFIIFYQSEYEQTATEALAILEYYRPELEEAFGHELEKLPVLIEDTGIANGFASPVDYRMSLFSTESGHENWLALVGVHEYVHMLSLSKTGGRVRPLENMFGNAFLPNVWLNGWLAEGIAVYHESQISPYMGRVNEGFYDAFTGVLAVENKLPSIVDASFFPDKYPHNAMYLYGAQFFDFLATEYGKEKTGELFAEHGSKLSSYATVIAPGIGIDRSAEEIFNKSLPELWDEWHEYEKNRFRDFEIKGERLTVHGWDASQTQWYQGKIYYYRSYPLKAGNNTFYQKEIVSYDPQTEQTDVIIDRRDLADISFMVSDDYIYYAVDKSVPGYANTSNNSFGTEKEIIRLHREKGIEEQMLEGSIRSFLPLSEDTILYSKDRTGEYGSELWQYSVTTGEKELLYVLDYLVHSMLAYEEVIIAVAGEKNRNSNIYKFPLETAEFTKLVGGPFTETQISLSGDRLIFSSNQDGVYRAYSYNLKDGSTYRLTENGFTEEPIYDSDNELLYYLSLTSEGRDLFKQEVAFEEYYFEPVEFTPLEKIPDSLEELDISVSQGNYSDNLKTLAPNMVLPYLSYSEEEILTGIYVQGSDALRHFPYNGLLAYNTAQNQFQYFFNIYSNLFLPCTVNLNVMKDSNSDNLNLDISYPLFSGSSQGLNTMIGGYYLSLENWSDWRMEPKLYAAFNYPKTDVYLNVIGIIEKKNRGHKLRADVNRYLLDGNFSFNVKLEGYENPVISSNIIRAYDQEMEFQQAESFSFEYTRDLYSIERGLWNPSIYLNDLYAKLFVDGMQLDRKDFYYSYGLELHLSKQIGTSYDRRINSSYIRFSWDDQGESQIGFGFGMPF